MTLTSSASQTTKQKMPWLLKVSGQYIYESINKAVVISSTKGYASDIGL
jgi:hypothetical protein